MKGFGVVLAATAADPSMFPEQLRGPDALSAWQVKKVCSGGGIEPRPGAGTPFPSPHRTTGFVPANLDDVAGVWTGYDSPYPWPRGNVQGEPAGTPKSWAQVAMEGTRAYPTQSRLMFQGVPIAGRVPAPAGARMAIRKAKLRRHA